MTEEKHAMRVQNFHDKNFFQDIFDWLVPEW
jgi:hypothetical protein